MSFEESPDHNGALDYEVAWQGWADFPEVSPTAVWLRRLILRRARRVNPRSWLDVGTGVGSLPAAAAPRHRGCEFLGVDIAPGVIERCRAKHSDLEWMALDIERTALDRTFDIVTFSEVVEHLEQPEAALRNLRAMCRGLLILTTPTGPVLPTDRHFGHQMHFAPAELEALVRAAGFTKVRVRRYGWPFQVLYRRLLNLAPERAVEIGAARRSGIAGRGLAVRLLSPLVAAAFELSVPRLGTQLVLTAHHS